MQLDRKQSILILMLLAIFVHRPLIITYLFCKHYIGVCSCIVEFSKDSEK